MNASEVVNQRGFRNQIIALADKKISEQPGIVASSEIDGEHSGDDGTGREKEEFLPLTIA